MLNSNLRATLEAFKTNKAISPCLTNATTLNPTSSHSMEEQLREKIK